MNTKNAIRMIVLLSLSLNMIACSTLFQNSEKNHKALCSELKHRIIFNGATSEQNVAFRERSEDPKLNQAYNDEKCD